MNLPGLVTLWLASGLAMVFAALRFGGGAAKQPVRSAQPRPGAPRRP